MEDASEQRRDSHSLLCGSENLVFSSPVALQAELSNAAAYPDTRLRLHVSLCVCRSWRESRHVDMNVCGPDEDCAKSSEQNRVGRQSRVQTFHVNPRNPFKCVSWKWI